MGEEREYRDRLGTERSVQESVAIGGAICGGPLCMDVSGWTLTQTPGQFEAERSRALYGGLRRIGCIHGGLGVDGASRPAAWSTSVSGCTRTHRLNSQSILLIQVIFLESKRRVQNDDSDHVTPYQIQP